MFLLIVGLVVLAVGNLRNPQVGFLALFGLGEGGPDAAAAAPVGRGRPGEPAAGVEEQPINWSEQLKARGLQTRLGDALRYVINKERGGPLAGVVVFSDGRENAGTGVHGRRRPSPGWPKSRSTRSAWAATSGRPTCGSSTCEAPERVYPGDRFTLTGYLQANGIGGGQVEVRLTSAPTGAVGAGEGRDARAGDAACRTRRDGEVVPVKFEITPDQPGRRTYR